MRKGCKRKRGMGGSIFSGAAKGASFGASIGTAVPVIGNVVGGAVGAVGGAIAGFFKGKKEKQQREAMEAALKANQEQQNVDYIADQMSLQTYDNMYNEVAYGGMIGNDGLESLASFLEAAQMNGGSQMLNSDMAKFQGNTHAAGGIELDANLDGSIDTEVEDGEVLMGNKVYSNRIKPDQALLDYMKDDGISVSKGSYAKIAERLGKMKGKYETKLQESVDEASVNTAQLMLERINNTLELLYTDQEISK